jgi:hypothetical protein
MRLQSVARSERFDAEVRLAALASLNVEINPLDQDLFAFLLDQVPSERSFGRRSIAARVLSRAALTDKQLLALAAALATTGPMELDRVLTAFEKSHDDQLGLRIAGALMRSPSARALRPERLEALFSQFSSHVAETAKPLFAAVTVSKSFSARFPMATFGAASVFFTAPRPLAWNVIPWVTSAAKPVPT